MLVLILIHIQYLQNIYPLPLHAIWKNLTWCLVIFTNIPIEETINYTTEKIDVNVFETDFQKIIDKTYHKM